MFPANILPGQGFSEFTVWESKAQLSNTGRTQTGVPTETERKFFGMLVSASQKEQDQWKQNGHPITHKIIEYSAEQKAGATDYLLSAGKEFYVQGVKNPANLNVTMIYYVEERYDIKKVSDNV